ncbi:MAG: hypothetical protein LBE04_04315 [Prevotellaceae bacterium]|jgi:hypothetical protein|nr:hypothetical protein [Prevotellaceae bacterium]
MIRHYFKVAFRNLWKYKSQTLISVIGLAVGFACFAMATLWIRYEMTYDSFLKNADWTYCVYNKDGYRDGNPHPIAGYLKSIFPEIANATAFVDHWEYVTINEMRIPVRVYEIDSTYFDIFDVKIIFHRIYHNERLARRLCDTDGDERICVCGDIVGADYGYHFLCRWKGV